MRVVALRACAAVGEIRFDEAIAATYDADSADVFDPAVLVPTVDLLAELAGGGAALELAVGTGRVALPLAARGIEVHGIEISPPMVAQLRTKPGGAGLPVHLGDMTTTVLDRRFALVYLVYNTITNLLTQDEQVACFANAARHLEPGGVFLIECGVPQLRRLPPGETVVPFDVSPRHTGFDEFTDLTEAQISYSHHIWVEGARAHTFSAPYRYVWPSELDLMARLAGLTLHGRWADFTKAPFTGDSPSHVSVWETPAAP